MQCTSAALTILAAFVWRCSAQVVVSADSKWRDCSSNGLATSYAYITGTDTSYTAGWAVNPSQSPLLNKGMNSTSELEAACDALLSEGQVGEIYVIENDPNCSTCLRMAIYNETTADHPGRQEGAGTGRWVCVKGLVAAPVKDCPTTVVSADSKWRDCSSNGLATSYAYITGTDTSYTAGWAVNPSQSPLLNKGMNSTSELEAACDALLSEGQVGEIYVIENDPNCSTCLRMAIYNETTADSPGRQEGAGTGRWVCVKGSVAAPVKDCPTTTAAATTTDDDKAPASGVMRLASCASLAWGAVAAVVL